MILRLLLLVLILCLLLLLFLLIVRCCRLGLVMLGIVPGIGVVLRRRLVIGWRLMIRGFVLIVAMLVCCCRGRVVVMRRWSVMGALSLVASMFVVSVGSMSMAAAVVAFVASVGWWRGSMIRGGWRIGMRRWCSMLCRRRRCMRRHCRRGAGVGRRCRLSRCVCRCGIAGRRCS